MNKSPKFGPGIYRGKVLRQAFTIAKTGTPQLILTFSLPVQSSMAEERNVHLSLTHGSRNLVEAALLELNFDVLTQNIKSLNPEELNYTVLAGRECDLQCTHKPYRGVLREQWRIYFSHYRHSQELGMDAMAEVEQIFAPSPARTTVQSAIQQPADQAIPIYAAVPSSSMPERRQSNLQPGNANSPPR